MVNKIYKSIAAAIFIALGVAVNLNMGYPLGPFLFAFGLLAVCLCNTNLYTGIVGFWWRKRPWEGISESYKLDILIVLTVNLLAGFLIGVLLGISNTPLAMEATVRISTWEISSSFFIESLFCGAIMYLCVYMWRVRRTVYGIFLGVPLFIFCGFQHSIANVITLGIMHPINPVIWQDLLCILIAVIGNAIGAIVLDILVTQKD